ncbi:MAG: hypothetical protein E4H06_04740 [Methanosarcina sp.]|nr:MAG: hypothetical protein E4H06_04740 [Methanosarcina sp.]
MNQPFNSILCVCGFDEGAEMPLTIQQSKPVIKKNSIPPGAQSILLSPQDYKKSLALKDIAALVSGMKDLF